MISLAEDRIYRAALFCLPGIGTKRYQAILDRFKSGKIAWEASKADWQAVEGIGAKTLQSVFANKNASFLSDLADRLHKNEIGMVFKDEPDYPILLSQIFDPPPLLFYRGKLPGERTDCISIVGSRRSTSYGERVAFQLAAELSRSGVPVVSGLARGIDGAAHLGVVQNQGITIAVLACGVDIIYPREHEKLAWQILASGAIVSEYPPGSPPEPGRFPARNRVIAGLCRGVVVVEAGERSGALITVDQALEQGRDVYAVPGPITSQMSVGCNRLIQQGAKLITGIKDILEDIDILVTRKVSEFNNLQQAISQEESKVIALLNEEDLSAEELASRMGLTFSQVAVLLTMLEIKNQVRARAGGKFQLTCQKPICHAD